MTLRLERALRICRAWEGASGFWLRAFGFGLLASGFWLLASGFWLPASDLGLQATSKALVIPNAAFFIAAEGSQSSQLQRVSLCLNGEKIPSELPASVRGSPGTHRTGIVGHVGDLDFGLTVLRLNVDCNHVLLILRDDRAVVLIGGRDHRIGELRLVEGRNLIQGIAALKTGGGRVNASERERSGAVLLSLCPGIDIHSHTSGRVVCALGGLHGTERSLHLHMVAILPHVQVARDPPADKRHRGHGQDAQYDEDSYDNQDDFQNAAAATLRGRC